MNLFDEIKEKINNKIVAENIIIIDNSHLHSKHKFFDKNKLHLKLIIKSKRLKNMSKIMAHKEIYNTLRNEMHNKIHALEIEIK
jgi:BolA family transcriptional regulator, general stress-responsive regulator